MLFDKLAVHDVHDYQQYRAMLLCSVHCFVLCIYIYIHIYFISCHKSRLYQYIKYALLELRRGIAWNCYYSFNSELQ